MDKLPFTTFDFWGYLASGFLLLCAIDNVAGYGLLARKDWTFVESVLAVSVAYVVGHVVAGFSSLVIERGLVGRLMGQYHGRVIASMDTSEYLPGQDTLAYLAAGVMVDTNYGGLVHYTDATADTFELLARSDS